MLTPEKIKEAYQNAIPHRRREFAKKVHRRLLTVAHEHGYQQKYPVDVLDMATAELRERESLAATRVRDLLDSGWRPQNQGDINRVFVDCFNQFDHWEKDPFTDLYDAVDGSFGKVGVHNPDLQKEYRRRLGEAQTQMSREFISDLECYVPKQTHQSISITNQGPVGAQQIGDGNVATVTQTVVEGAVKEQVLQAVNAIRARLPELPESDQDEMLEHLASIDEELETASPRPSRLVAALKAIGRLAAGVGQATIVAVTQGAIKGLTGQP